MNELQVVNMDGQQTVNSREVAKMIDVQHKNLLQKIRNYEDILAGSDFSSLDFFIPSTYLDAQKKSRDCYLLTKKGCEMVANKITGEKGILFTAKYVEAFNDMEKKINADRKKFIKELLTKMCTNVMSLNDKVERLEKEMTVTTVQQRNLKYMVMERVSTLLGGNTSPLYKKMSNRLIRALWTDYKRYYKLHSYKETLRSDFRSGIKYIDNWRPDTNLMLEIQKEIRSMRKK